MRLLILNVSYETFIKIVAQKKLICLFKKIASKIVQVKSYKSVSLRPDQLRSLTDPKKGFSAIFSRFWPDFFGVFKNYSVSNRLRAFFKTSNQLKMPKNHWFLGIFSYALSIFCSFYALKITRLKTPKMAFFRPKRGYFGRKSALKIDGAIS